MCVYLPRISYNVKLTILSVARNASEGSSLVDGAIVSRSQFGSKRQIKEVNELTFPILVVLTNSWFQNSWRVKSESAFHQSGMRTCDMTVCADRPDPFETELLQELGCDS